MKIYLLLADVLHAPADLPGETEQILAGELVLLGPLYHSVLVLPPASPGPP